MLQGRRAADPSRNTRADDVSTPGSSRLLTQGGCLHSLTSVANPVACLWLTLGIGTLQQAVLTECIASEVLAIPLLFMTRAHATCDWALVLSLSIFGVSRRAGHMCTWHPLLYKYTPASWRLNPVLPQCCPSHGQCAHPREVSQSLARVGSSHNHRQQSHQAL
jgi:hypothetical protein